MNQIRTRWLEGIFQDGMTGNALNPDLVVKVLEGVLCSEPEVEDLSGLASQQINFNYLLYLRLKTSTFWNKELRIFIFGCNVCRTFRLQNINERFDTKDRF